MPKYTYYCHNCKKEFDISVPLGQDASDCPVCGCIHITKQIPEFQSFIKQEKKAAAGDNIRKYIEENRREKRGIGEDFQGLEKEFNK